MMDSEKQFFVALILVVGMILLNQTTSAARLAQSSVPASIPTSTPTAGLTIEVLDNMTRFPGGLDSLPIPTIPRRNPQTPRKVALGRTLFFDKALSRNSSISCATCHDPKLAFSDGRTQAVGVTHVTLRRRSPSLLNSAYNSIQFWDGRAKSLEDQAIVPLLSKDEMGLPTARALLSRVAAIPEYRRKFQLVFGRPINVRDIEYAIAAFERTLVTPDSPFDRYARGDKRALTDQQKRGLIVFIGKGACSQCHNGANFTDNKFHSLGVTSDHDLGRFAVSKKSGDLRAFKTPSLRSASEQTAFMHNGSIATLAQVIEFYNQGAGKAPKSSLLFKLHLSAPEKDDLLAFLQALAGRVPPIPRN